MNIKTGIMIAAFIPCMTFASDRIKSEQELKDERMNILASLGLPLPDSGIQLVPRSMLNLSENQLNKGNKEEEQIKSQGYADEETSRPQELLNFKSHAMLEFKNNEGNLRNSSTHIRHNIKDLKLGFEFKGVHPSLMTNYIGVVPQGGFHKEGWSGAVQFFDNFSIGVCAYAIMNVAVSHTAARLAIESVTYDVNDKATLKHVMGSKSSGFIYKVKWYDNDNFHELECASLEFSEDTNNAVIQLANDIDRNL